MDKAEARQVLAGKIAQLRRWLYTDLRRFMEPEGLEVAGPSSNQVSLQSAPAAARLPPSFRKSPGQREAHRPGPTQEPSMEFFCDLSSLDGVLVDDLVLSFSAKDDVPIAMALADTPARSSR
jgi:hypothetical protein